MHTNVHCSIVYNSKDLEPTQMPIDDRLYRENVAHIHHGILCSHKKRWVYVLCRDMDESGEHHSQQTDTRTENEIPYILTHRWVMNNENTWTEGGEHYTLGSIEGNRGWIAAEGAGEGYHREKCQMWVKGRKTANHIATCVPMQLSCMFCTCTPKPKMQLKKKEKRKCAL